MQSNWHVPIQAAMALGKLAPGETVLNWFERNDTGIGVATDTIDRERAFSCAVDFSDVALFAMRTHLDAVADLRSPLTKEQTQTRIRCPIYVSHSLRSTKNKTAGKNLNCEEGRWFRLVKKYPISMVW